MSLLPFAARALVAARLRAISAFSAVFVLWLLFELPLAIRPDGLAIRGLRFTGDFLVLLTAYFLLRRRRGERILRRVWVVLMASLVFVRVDWTVSWLITRTRPLFYDQLFLIRHLVVLVSDLWSGPVALGLVGLVLGVVLTVVIARALSRVGRAAFEPPLRRPFGYALGVAWCAIVVLTFVGAKAGADGPLARWMFPELVVNVRESYRTYRDVREAIVDSPYDVYKSIRLFRRPNVSFFFVESYGKVIADSPDLAKRFTPRLARIERSFDRDGWHMVSGFCTAPVSGGRSWLAVGSIFMGTPVRYESVFRHLVGASPRVPSIPQFFAGEGYQTIGLEPSDRVRAGVEDVNYYHLARQIRFDDLHYTGKAIGWGLVPDQYALGYANNNVLGTAVEPRFFMFHMVSSHMPWSVVPTIVNDWRTLGDPEGQGVWDAHSEEQTLRQHLHTMWARLARYGRDELHQLSKPPSFDKDLRQRYVDTVLYDLSLIERQLVTERGDELVIVMGDHQPPAVTSDGESFDVPVHVFARDPALLAEFVDRGFAPGLALDAKTPPVVEHAGLFSLLVRDLVRVQPSAPPLPRYLPHGVSFTKG
ncbi:MAG TPA: hypothetical protein VHC69_11230 [Polyangiaceae bacterium]|nr:hypothetical protein [Polyangiaceae bacterium]